jgi:hypothetical protein
MQTRSKILGSTAIACAMAFNGCSNTAIESPVYLGVTVSPRPASIPAGGTMVFTATVSNGLSVPQWSLLDAAEATSAGTLTPIGGSTDTILYTAPATPPIYTNTITGLTQGAVTLDVSVNPLPGTSYPVAQDAVSFFITTPSVTVALSPATATVALGTTEQFIGYAVGSTNNALTWQVNGVAGGSTSTGTIAGPSGLYTAPPNLPMGGNTVTITAVSQADPTKSASAVVTLQ